ncbi:MAG: hypothetical protein Q7T86_02165 [Hyphomicrobiaceae bacterium]|nr:hypothetical protein [Hyphomicrobiaceae bacterium]
MSNKVPTIAAGVLPALLLASVAMAAAPEGGGGRYTMSPTEGGFVRLDTVTGTMALCTRKDSDWACADMPESADASRTRIEKLEGENKELKNEIKRLEETFGQGNGAAPGGPGDTPKPFAMPDEKDVDKAFDYMESMIKKFRERMKKLEEKEGGEGTPL